MLEPLLPSEAHTSTSSANRARVPGKSLAHHASETEPVISHHVHNRQKALLALPDVGHQPIIPAPNSRVKDDLGLLAIDKWAEPGTLWVQTRWSARHG